MSHDKKTRATVVQRYHFSSGLRRMSATVLLEEDDAPQPKPMALMKGAPEVVRQFLKEVGCLLVACIRGPEAG
jgi:magnesium-transporting ATPase (P-type)